MDNLGSLILMRSFIQGSPVKNPPANARDTGSIPDWGTQIPKATQQELLRFYELFHQ